MKLRIFEVLRDDGDIDLFFDGLTREDDFELILKQFLTIKGVRIIRKNEDEPTKACLLSNGMFDFVLVYSPDIFVWNYAYAVQRENHNLLKELCSNFAEFITTTIDRVFVKGNK